MYRLSAAGAGLLAFGAAVLMGCAPQRHYNALPLLNADFEDPHAGPAIPGWVVLQHAGPPSYESGVDGATAASGKSSFRLHRIKRQDFGSIVQTLTLPRDAVGKTLRLRAKVRTAGVSDGQWMLAATFVAGGSAIVDQAKSAGVKGDTDWSELTLEAPVPARAMRVKIGAILTGDGSAWLDDVHLELAD